MNLLLLGATGRTGKILLEMALARGYIVHCLVRDKTKLPSHPNIHVFEGLPSDFSLLNSAIQNCDFVVNVLNISRTSDFPWSPLRTPEDFLSKVMTQLTQVIDKTSLKRVVVCTAWGTNETKYAVPFWFRWFIDHSNIGSAYTDHERQERVLEKSSIPWTIVKPVGLTNSKSVSAVLEIFDPRQKPRLTISRSTLACYLLDALTKDELLNKKVVISNA